MEERKLIRQGVFVTWKGRGGRKEKGRVKDVSGDRVFVVFNCNGLWHEYHGYTAAACDIKDLTVGW